jgi:small subunit ribosomal protein S19
MSRSRWKGPFVDLYLVEKVRKNENNKTIPIKTWSRRSVILPNFVGYTFNVHNGFKFNVLKIKEEMVGYKFGEFCFTRKPAIHGKKTKKR